MNYQAQQTHIDGEIQAHDQAIEIRSKKSSQAHSMLQYKEAVSESNDNDNKSKSFDNLVVQQLMFADQTGQNGRFDSKVSQNPKTRTTTEQQDIRNNSTFQTKDIDKYEGTDPFQNKNGSISISLQPNYQSQLQKKKSLKFKGNKSSNILLSQLLLKEISKEGKVQVIPDSVVPERTEEYENEEEDDDDDDDYDYSDEVVSQKKLKLLLSEYRTTQDQGDETEQSQSPQLQKNTSLKDQWPEIKEICSEKLLVLFQLLLNFVLFLIVTVFYIPFYGIYAIGNLLWNKQFGLALKTFQFYISNLCTIYSLFSIFFLPNDNPLIVMLCQDCIFFLLTSYLVYSYLKVVLDKQMQDLNRDLSFCDKIDRMINLLLQNYEEENKHQIYRFDYFFYQNMASPNYKNKITGQNHKNQNIKISHKLFLKQFKHESRHAQPNKLHFILIFIVISLKLILVFKYIDIQPDTLDFSHQMQMFIVIFTYIQIAWSLNVFLGNYDLIRKRERMQVLIDTYQSREGQNRKVITSPIELELWDDMRKYMLSYQKEYLDDLEVTYFYLIFYFLFVTLVCASAFFELYWIIQKDSFLLAPVNVIMNTFNFMYMSLLLLFRIKSGTDFNNTFQQLRYEITQMKDVISDLLTLQIEENDRQYKIIKKTEIYQIFLKELEGQSLGYINTKTPFQDKIYTLNNKGTLKRKLLKNLEKTYSKLHSSIKLDEEEYKYKFGDFFEVDFKEFALTVLLALITSLPTIVPIFIDYFTV